MHKNRLWTHWVFGLIVILLLIAATSWLASWARGGRTIHFWMDDATGLEPGTVVNLSGVRAGAVTDMSLDADPSRRGEPRAKVRVRLTTDAADLVNPGDWVVAVTTSPLPGFKAGVDLVRNDGPALPAFPDGAWHTDTRSAITKQINMAFDALLNKLHGLSGNPDGQFSLKDILPGHDGEGGPGDGTLISWVLNKEQVDLLTAVLKNMDSLTGTAVDSMKQGGIARAALGDAGHANLLQLTDDLGKTVGKLRKDLEQGGNLLQVLLAKEDSRRVSGVLKNVDSLTSMAVEGQREGGLAKAALGAAGHANLLRMTDDLTGAVNKLRRDLEGEGNLLGVLLAKEDSQRISDLLKNVDDLTGSAVESQRVGGLAHTALGPTGHANLLQLTDDAAKIASRVRGDLEDDGTLLQLLFTKEDSDKISDLLGNVDRLSQRVAALDLTPLQDGVRSLSNMRTALDHVSGMISRLIAPRPDGRPSELEEELAELPQHIKQVYDSVDKATRSTEEIMDQTAEVLRKANLTVSSINQILTGLKRSWLFRGAFNESLRYEDLAPYLVPSQNNEQFDYEELLNTLDGGQ